MRRILLHIFRLALAINSPALAAWVCARMTSAVNGPASVRVLCLKKTVFWDDLLVMASRTESIQYLEFPRLLLSDIVRRHTDRFSELNDSSYHPIMEGTASQERILSFMSDLVVHLRKRIGFDAVLAGNYVYVSQQEFFRAMRKQGVPVLVLYKEGIGAAVSMNDNIRQRMYGTKQFHADRIMFYNRHIRDALVSSDIPGLTPERTVVVGIPRFDVLVNGRAERRPDRIQTLVHFSYETDVKSDRFMHGEKDQNRYEQRLETYQRSILRLAVSLPDLQIIVKTKGGDHARKEMQRLLKLEPEAAQAANLRISATDDVEELIRQADVVSGYLSTALLEALVIGCAVITPKTSDLPSEQAKDFFDDPSTCVRHIRDGNDLLHVMKHPAELPLPTAEELQRLLEPFIYSMDGRSSQRVEDEILASL